MRTTVTDKFIVFPSNAMNAIKAMQEIDQISYCQTQPFETVIAVLPDDPNVWQYSKPSEILMKTKKILAKYSIPYKVKRMTW